MTYRFTFGSQNRYGFFALWRPSVALRSRLLCGVGLPVAVGCVTTGGFGAGGALGGFGVGAGFGGFGGFGTGTGLGAGGVTGGFGFGGRPGLRFGGTGGVGGVIGGTTGGATGGFGFGAGGVTGGTGTGTGLFGLGLFRSGRRTGLCNGPSGGNVTEPSTSRNGFMVTCGPHFGLLLTPIRLSSVTSPALYF